MCCSIENAPGPRNLITSPCRARNRKMYYVSNPLCFSIYDETRPCLSIPEAPGKLNLVTLHTLTHLLGLSMYIYMLVVQSAWNYILLAVYTILSMRGCCFCS